MDNLIVEEFERPIGDKFKYRNIYLKIIEMSLWGEPNCRRCYFKDACLYKDKNVTGKCFKRKDGRNAIFVEINKKEFNSDAIPIDKSILEKSITFSYIDGNKPARFFCVLTKKEFKSLGYLLGESSFSMTESNDPRLYLYYFNTIMHGKYVIIYKNVDFL